MYLFKLLLFKVVAKIYNKFVLHANGISIGKRSTINGFLYVETTGKSKISIGDDFRCNSSFHYNHIGRQQRSSLICYDGEISLGNNVGMSSTVLVSRKSIRIGDNVRIGGNVVIYDNDFHSLRAQDRTSIPEIKSDIGKAQVVIGDYVFIGAHSIILKGSKIGKGSIIGAGSLVASCNVPAFQVWAGNPAVFIRDMDDKS